MAGSSSTFRNRCNEKRLKKTAVFLFAFVLQEAYVSGDA